ncbi:zinc finger MYND domain-containing protein 11 isoform X2 [Tribolium castaneum]|uniref:Zinc finger MYND domain-containing protein 11-like Protein n=1 Tax=Tribolium castaneum TaxID=7070 RepID=D6WNL8_TRICA|nr:PREDICTED: zinc finger MYND domain-containing protein 11 isoform X2 [Tribolium castaneum]EFA03764.2 Zinc finger MYND domain-containing protein 11-like Protein [Tribolium castaneum]|eukprot:XP_008192944.1 PREDICTED: zinc finger MYND domain-containing protein 11 isoform X2 [Tribolium castaneum]
MPIRRAADPITVQHVWDAIRSAVLQRQMADSKRIIKYLQRVDNCTYAQAELYVQQTHQDGLIVALQKVTKTSKGDLVDSFRIPTHEVPPLDGKDWYCFECHLAGDVTACQQCFRVFHADCVPNGRLKFQEYKKTNILYDQLSKSGVKDESTSNSVNSINISSDSDDLNASELSTYKFNNNGQMKSDALEYDETLCSMCNVSKLDDGCNLEKSELNYLLKFVIHRIQSWLPHTLTHTMAQQERPEWLTDKELSWRANQLFFEHRDMSVIEVNLNNESYTKLYQFLADVLTIQHNVAIFHGIESQEYGAAELMIRDCMHDLTELKLCVDCYRHSNEKINAKWFCLPCRVPHKLVWAKQKGYPYWPAKVIQETSTHFDVRFFGGKYERSLLIKSLIKPIETPQSKLQIKTSSAFNKAVEELRFHQRLMQNPDELQKLISSSKNRVRSLNKQRISTLKKSLNSSLEVKKRNSFEMNDVYKFEDNPFGQQNLSLTHKRKSSFCEGSPVSKKNSTSSVEKNEEVHNTSDSVIHISDGEDDEYPYYDYSSVSNTNYNGSYEQVSSSTENYRFQDRSQENGMQQLDHPYSDSVEKMRRRLECVSDKKELIKCAMDCMQSEIDQITNNHNDHLKRLFESHNAQISEIKKKQWCYNCEQEAIYHCCWNTAYCSQSCQQQHWQAEHKKVCRRKR